MFRSGKKTVRIVVMLFAGLLALATTAAADEVTMKNGDRLSGQVVKMEDGQLILKTSYAGELKIKWAEVAGLATDGPVAVKCQDGLIQGTADKCPTGIVVSSDDGKTQMVLAEVEAINPPDREKFTIKGGVNVSAWSKRGNTHKDNYDVLADVNMAWGVVNRLDLHLESHYTEDKGATTEENSLGTLEYDRFISKKVYAFANGQAAQDKFRDLNLRTAVGAGLGYQFLATPRTDLSFEVGPNYIYEDGDIRGQSDWFAWRWQLKLSWWLWPKVAQFYHNDWGYVRMDDFERYFLSSYTGIKFPLGGGFDVKVQYDYNYDSDPQPGKENYDSRSMLLIGYAW